MKIRTAMIVDDSDSDQFLARARLLQFDPEMEIVQAYDGQEALEKLEDPNVNPDVILLDINMPRMNGIQFVCELRKRPRFAQKPVILLAAEDEAAEYPELATLNDIYCLEKGFEPRALVQSVAQILQQDA